MFGGAVQGTATLSAPEVEAMARVLGPLTQGDALAYAGGLDQNEQGAKSGCYVVHCVRPCRCPVGCVYNCVCGDCLWPGIGTLPFGCCYILNMMGADSHYTNAKGDTLVMKVDAKHETLACYLNGCGVGPCCYCLKK